MALDENKIINTEVEAVTCRQFFVMLFLLRWLINIQAGLFMRRKTILVG